MWFNTHEPLRNQSKSGPGRIWSALMLFFLSLCYHFLSCVFLHPLCFLAVVSSHMSCAHGIVGTLSDQWAHSDYWWTSALDHRDNVLIVGVQQKGLLTSNTWDPAVSPLPHGKGGVGRLRKDWGNPCDPDLLVEEAATHSDTQYTLESAVSHQLSIHQPLAVVMFIYWLVGL